MVPCILAVLWTWFIVGCTTEAGNKNIKGIEAINMATNDRIGTTGEMNITNFENAYNALTDALNDDKTKFDKTSSVLKYWVYIDRLITQNVYNNNDNYLNVSRNLAKNYYSSQDTYYKNLIKDKANDEKQEKLALSLWSTVKKPYTYFSGFKTWHDGIEHIMLFTFVLMLIISIFAGSIIAKDKENGLYEITATTACFGKSLTLSKIIIPLIIASLIYICGIGFYILLLTNLLPNNALDTSLQITNTSFVPYTLRELLCKMFIYGWIGMLTIASVTTFISSFISKSSKAISISILIILSSFFLNIFINSNDLFFNVIKLLLPGGITFFYQTLDFPIETYFGKATFIPSIWLLISIFILLLSTVLATFNYRRRQS